MTMIIANRFILKEKIGAGSFGDVYAGYDQKTKKKVALKFEKIKPVPAGNNGRQKAIQLLRDESFIYKSLDGMVGIPQLFWFGKQSSYNIMVIDLLDQSLEDLHAKLNHHFSLKTVLMLADQMISCLESFHRKKLIHRDLKPENFMVGFSPFMENSSQYSKSKGKSEFRSHIVHLIDFGLSRKYIDEKTNQHISLIEHSNVTGTVRYSSINALLGYEQSRRDDLESLAYVLIYFLQGSLPWQNLPGRTRKEKIDYILANKKETPIEELCKGMPVEFATFLYKVRKLEFAEEPQYSEYRNMFRELFIKSGFVYDYHFDWMEKSPIEYEREFFEKVNSEKTEETTKQDFEIKVEIPTECQQQNSNEGFYMFCQSQSDRQLPQFRLNQNETNPQLDDTNMPRRIGSTLNFDFLPSEPIIQETKIKPEEFNLSMQNVDISLIQPTLNSNQQIGLHHAHEGIFSSKSDFALPPNHITDDQQQITTTNESTGSPNSKSTFQLPNYFEYSQTEIHQSSSILADQINSNQNETNTESNQHYYTQINSTESSTNESDQLNSNQSLQNVSNPLEAFRSKQMSSMILHQHQPKKTTTIKSNSFHSHQIGSSNQANIICSFNSGQTPHSNSSLQVKDTYHTPSKSCYQSDSMQSDSNSNDNTNQIGFGKENPIGCSRPQLLGSRVINTKRESAAIVQPSPLKLNNILFPNRQPTNMPAAHVQKYCAVTGRVIQPSFRSTLPLTRNYK